MHEYVSRMTVTEFRKFSRTLRMMKSAGVDHYEAVELLASSMQKRSFDIAARIHQVRIWKAQEAK